MKLAPLHGYRWAKHSVEQVLPESPNVLKTQLPAKPNETLPFLFVIGGINALVVSDDANGRPAKHVSQLPYCLLIDTANVALLPFFVIIFIVVVLEPFEDDGILILAFGSLLVALSICAHGLAITRFLIVSYNAFSAHHAHYGEPCAINDAFQSHLVCCGYRAASLEARQSLAARGVVSCQERGEGVIELREEPESGLCGASGVVKLRQELDCEYGDVEEVRYLQVSWSSPSVSQECAGSGFDYVRDPDTQTTSTRPLRSFSTSQNAR